MKVVCLALVALLALPPHADAYLHFEFTFRGQTVTLKWDRPSVRWFAADRPGGGVSASDFQRAMSRAFATWEAVPTATIAFQFGGFTGAHPFEDDDLSVLGFENEPEMEGVLGATGYVIDVLTGEILESDIFFNSAFAWSTSDAGDPARFDLESVALHEIGHFIGLGHSALGETDLIARDTRRVVSSGSVMFPISMGRGITHDRGLQPDDIAGVSDLYPAEGFRAATGAIRGQVLRGSAGVLGAHVIAFHPESGDLVAGFSLNGQGDFEIAGLRPGPHIIRVEPLDDADIDSFFSEGDPVDITFRATFHERLFVAPAGGVGERIAVTVAPK